MGFNSGSLPSSEASYLLNLIHGVSSADSVHSVCRLCEQNGSKSKRSQGTGLDVFHLPARVYRGRVSPHAWILKHT